MFFNDALIGYTGFVGKNIMHHHSFVKQYNSRNIGEIKNCEFNTVICSGAYGLKWKANKYPEEDYNSIYNLIENLKAVKTKRLILISTVDVYPTPNNVDEDTVINIDKLSPYGKNRRLLELFVEERFDSTIIRLPLIYGQYLKKNIIYDLINNKYDNLRHKNSIYQFYDLRCLWGDIQIAISNDIKILNIASEPISLIEICNKCFQLDLSDNSLQDISAANYDFHSKYSELWGNTRNYLYSKKETLKYLIDFVQLYK